MEQNDTSRGGKDLGMAATQGVGRARCKEKERLEDPWSGRVVNIMMTLDFTLQSRNSEPLAAYWNHP